MDATMPNSLSREPYLIFKVVFEETRGTATPLKKKKKEEEDEDEDEEGGKQIKCLHTTRVQVKDAKKPKSVAAALRGVGLLVVGHETRGT
jgi:predicted phosphodiesterase